jgi:hypothetical protein
MSVYVGIDVHRERSWVAVVTEDGTVRLNRRSGSNRAWLWSASGQNGPG